jgi:hypothetical protein
MRDLGIKGMESKGNGVKKKRNKTGLIEHCGILTLTNIARKYRYPSFFC